MNSQRAFLIGICRPVPNVLSFVTPIFRDDAGASVAQVVKDGRIVSFQPVDLGEEFVTLSSRASAGIGDPALYAMEFEDCISVGPAMSDAVSSPADGTELSESNAVRTAFGRNRNVSSSGFLTFRRRAAAHEQFEAELDHDAAVNVDTEEERDWRVSEWFRTWREPICDWLQTRALASRVDADDLAQEVFLRILRYSDDIPVDNASDYLLRIAANVVNEWSERPQSRHPVDDTRIAELQITSGDEPAAALDKVRFRKQVRLAIERLPRRQREVLLLHVNEGLSYREIAQKQKLSTREVAREIRKAYSTLQAQFQSEES